MKPIVFDFDGVLVDSELVWHDVRRDFTEANGGTWHEGANSDMQGLSTAEWSAFMADDLGVDLGPDAIAEQVVAEMERRLTEDPPFLDGAQNTVRKLADDGRTMGVASSSPRDLLHALLEAGGIEDCFGAVVSSEEVENGKPSPDVYLEAARRLQVDPSDCLAVEDSGNGIRAAHAAGMEVLAVPNPHDPPGDAALALASRTGESVAALLG